jgi:hypothetical protein
MQALALALIGLGGVVVIVVLAIWARNWLRPPRGGTPPPIDPVDVDPDVPTFRVVALGLEGAGKTVLLASQSHTLRPVSDRRYFLDGDLTQDRLLASLYQKVRDTSAPWPSATRLGDTRQLLFDCKAHDRTREERTIFRISFLDYAGEILEPGEDVTPATGELKARIDDAHALLVIVDGRRVQQLLRDEQDGRDYFDRRLWPLLGLAHRALCPVQLVVTKWDLVRSGGDPADDDELLRQVSRRLTAYGSIKQLVHAHCQRQEEVRLIPVSAVGPHFTELRGDTVIKRTDGTLDPIHVDIPLCAVIPDALKRLDRSLDPSVRKTLEDEIDQRPFGDVAEIASSVLNSAGGRLLRDALGGLVGDAVVKLFVELLVQSKSRGISAPRENDDVEAETQRLRAEVIKDMERVVERFEDRLPSSILCTRR